MTNINENLEASASQNKRILAYLKSGNTITQLKALKLFNCFRLASRISDIKAKGYAVIGKMVTDPITGKRYKEYKIENNYDLQRV